MKEVIQNIKDKYDFLGTEELEDGTLLVGHAPYVAPYAYLHSFYTALTDHEINKLEEEVSIKFPRCIKEMYKQINGLTLFVDTLNIYGMRRKNERSVLASRQPYDLVTPNVDERIKNATDDMLFIAGYSWNGSRVYVDIKTEEVFFCNRYDTAPLMSWKSIDDWFEKEAYRLIAHHKENGMNIPYSPTVPVGGEEVANKLIEFGMMKNPSPYWYKETIETYRKNPPSWLKIKLG